MGEPGADCAAITLSVALGERSYPIVIGAGVLSAPGTLAVLDDRDVLVVTNETVDPLYGPVLAAALGQTARRVAREVLPDGERCKDLGAVGRIIDALVRERMNRDCVLVALGGGVVGDITGFAAACYQRGVDFVQVPTTLLAQVDSSVGGKTGVNHPGGKNLIGAFHQPILVVADTGTLATLPAREYAAGLAEVVKYGLIRDAAFFTWIEAHVDELNARDPAAVAYAIRRSCAIKAEIVALDERESGVRAHLNLGHTFGHAIETATGYGDWLHGEAVAAGMVLAADLSRALGGLDAATVDRIRWLLDRCNLPTTAPPLGAERARSLMGMDKKVIGGRLRLVLLECIGRAIVRDDVPDGVLSGILREAFDRDRNAS